MTKEETAMCLGLLSAGFPQVTVTRETASVYHEVLKDIDGQVALKAVKSLLATAEWFPPPAIIRKKVAEILGVLAPSATDALTEIIGQVKIAGRDHLPTFSHPAIKKVVDAIGWREVCMSSNQEALRAHIFRLYDDQKAKFDMLAQSEHGQLSGSSQHSLTS